MSFKLFTQVMVLTQGGPLGSTNTLVYMIYDTGFIDQRLGYSSAISVVFFLIVLAISLIQQKATKMTSK
jgi:ABC-type sugar transport system permease subunit